MSLSFYELLFEILLGCPFNSWFFPPECVSLVVTRAISEKQKQRFIIPEGKITKNTFSFIQYKIARLLYNIAAKTKRLWGSAGARLLWGNAPLQLGSSATLSLTLPSRNVFDVTDPAGETVFTFQWKGKCALRAEGELTSIDRSSCSWFLIG